MKITCENCGSEHELDPPAWVVSSGRAFRFRCSSCGHSQMAEPPTAIELTDEHGPKDHGPFQSQGTTISPEDDDDDSGEHEAAREAPGSVFLKQDGKVYLVKDWATLQRWIMERRVGREDLVSEGGVRWEPIGTRPELGSFFAAVEQLEAVDTAFEKGAPFPIGGETPFSSGESASPFVATPQQPGASSTRRGLARLDDETEGVPIGLPPLPTEEVELGLATPAPLPTYAESPPTRFRDNPFQKDPLEPPSLEIPVPSPPPFHHPVETVTPAFAMPPAEPPPSEPEPPAEVEAEPDHDFVISGADDEDEDEHVEEVLDPPPLSADEDSEDFDPDALFAGFGDETASGEAPVADQWTAETEPEPRRGSGPLLFAIGVGALLLLGIPAALYAVWSLGSTPTEDTELLVDTEAPRDTDAATPDTDAAAPDTDAATPDTDAAGPDTETTDTDAADTDAADTDVSVDTDASTPEVPPTPPVTPPVAPPVTPPVVSRPSVAALRARGWAAADGGDRAKALGFFQQALARAPNDADSNYGHGYVLLQGGDNAGAVPYLCKAIANAGSRKDIEKEVTGIMEQKGLTCP